MQKLSLDLPLDDGIAGAVELLRGVGIATVESCEGGIGHCFPEPTIRFMGDKSEAWRALSAALKHDLPVLYLRMQWTISQDGDPEGPYWEIVLREKQLPVI